MIEGFETETDELSIEEIFISVVIYRALRKRVSKEQSITSAGIISGMNTWLKENGSEYNMTGPRLRKMIHHLRCNPTIPEVIISTGNGYYIWDGKSPEEVIKYAKSLRQRISSIQSVYDAIVHKASIRNI